MAIKCGHCKNYHDSIDAVKTCSAEEQESRAEYEWDKACEVAAMRYAESVAERGGWFGYGE